MTWQSRGCEFLKVWNEPRTRDLVKKLRREYGPPGTTYFARDGHVLAWQWRTK